MMHRLFAVLGLRHTAPPVAPHPAEPQPAEPQPAEPQPAEPQPADPPPQAGEPPRPNSAAMRRLGRESLHAGAALARTLKTKGAYSAWGEQVSAEIHQKCEAYRALASELGRAGHAAADAGDLQTAADKLTELENLISEAQEYAQQTDAHATTAVSRLWQHQLAAQSTAHLSRQLDRLRLDTQTPLSNEHSELAQAIQSVLQKHPHGAPVKNWQREMMRRSWDVAAFCGGHVKRDVFDAIERMFSERNNLWRRTENTSMEPLDDTDFPEFDDPFNG